MAGWMINCKAYAELSSQRMDRHLSLWDRISMKLHQLLCPPCGLIHQQFKAIRNACRFSYDDGASDEDGRLPDEARERMKAVMKKVTQDTDSR
jgi:hypothetical protein